MRLTDEQANPAGLTGWPQHIQDAIRSEADTWRYGNVKSALTTFEGHVAWARGMNQEQRRYHRSGAWYANLLMRAAAIAYVQTEQGDDPNCDSHICPPDRSCHPRRTDA